MTEETLSNTSVDIDPFLELKEGRIGLQAFTQALWLCARDSRKAAESVLVRLEGLLQDGVLDANKFQELQSMTRSLIENAGTRDGNKASAKPQITQTAIGRQKAKFLAEKTQSKVSDGSGLVGKKNEGDAEGRGERFLDQIVNSADINKSTADAQAAVTETKPSIGVAPGTIVASLDLTEALGEKEDAVSLTRGEASAANSSTVKRSTEVINTPAPVFNLKPAADAQARPLDECVPSDKQSSDVTEEVQTKRSPEAGDSVHKAATVDPALTTVHLNTAEHLSFESEDADHIEPLHADSTMQYAPAMSTRHKRRGRTVFIVSLLAAGLVSTWYAQDRGWIDIKSTAADLYESIAHFELFNESSSAPDFHADEAELLAVGSESRAELVSDELDAALQAKALPQETSSTGTSPSFGDAASRALYEELVRAASVGKLEPASKSGTALNLLSALEAQGVDPLSIQRAKARIAQAYLNEARRARQVNDWTKAELLVSKAVRLRESAKSVP